MSDKSPPRQRWWNIEGWGLRRKVTAVLAVPVTVAMVLGGLRVENELSNAVHFSSAADEIAVVPDIVQFSTAFATATGSAAAGTVTPDEMNVLGEAFVNMRTVAENPELDDEVVADLTRALSTAESLYSKMQTGRISVDEIATVTNDVRDTLNRIVESVLDGVEDREILNYSNQLVNAWYSQRYLFGQVLGVLELLANPEQPGTVLVSASGAELAMLELLAGSYPEGDEQIAALRAGVQERTNMVAAAGEGPLPILNVRTSLLSSVDVYGGIIDDTAQQITTAIQDRAAETRSAALRDTAIVLAALLAALVLALLVSRSLVGPIRRLRYGTLKVARQELPEAIDRIKVGDSIEDIEFTRVPVHTTEEIGQLARAVDDMHGQALRLAGEQAHLRLQINDMFETLARRSKSLVEQQLGLIERLEFEEKDPNRLESLFRLDHLAARMRRNGDNLLILSGTRMRRGHSAPVQLGDILRAAMSEVEDYQRVQIGSTPDGALSGAVATDIVHLLAELVDNSLRASPPDSTVTFSFARAVDGGLLVEIADRGIGIPFDELEIINQRLTGGGEVGPDTARHMGLFVVSRLAERHGLTVRLRPTFDTARNPGITASVHIPDVLLVSPLALSQTGPQPRIEASTEHAPQPQQELPQLPAPVAKREFEPVRSQAVRSEEHDRSRYAQNDFQPERRDSGPARTDFAPTGMNGTAEPTVHRAAPTGADGTGERPQDRERANSAPPMPRAPAAPAESAARHESGPSGLPQRRSGGSPGLPAREPGSTPGLPTRQPGSSSGLPTRQPGATPGLPTRQPGATPGLPTREPGATPGLPQPQQQTPRRIQPDAAAAFVSALPPRGNHGPPPASGRPTQDRPWLNERGPNEQGLNEQDRRQPPRDERPAGHQGAHASNSLAPDYRSDTEPARREGYSGLPQRQPGSVPDLPQRAAAPARQEPARQSESRSSGLPQRQPGTTPGLPGRVVPQHQAPQPQPQSPQQPVHQQSPQPVHQQRPSQQQPQQEVSTGLPQRRPGTTPGLPRREPGATPGLPPRPAGAEPPSAAVLSGPSQIPSASIADGGSVAGPTDAQNAARHRYRTNSARTASFFQPRPDAGALRPQPVNTPIFSDMMSDWLVDPASLPEDRRKKQWRSAADAGWEAAQRAAEVSVEEHTTAGLPRREPGHRLVPGAVRAPVTGELPKMIRRRDPESIRANLSRHQQGVRNGRTSGNTSNRENNEQGVR